MFGRSSDDVLLLPRRIHSRSQNSARMKKTTFFGKSTFWVSTFLPLLSPKWRTHFGVRKQYQAKSAYARFIFEQVKEMFFFAFCTHKMDSFVSYFAGFLRKQIKQVKNYFVSWWILKSSNIKGSCFFVTKTNTQKYLFLNKKHWYF